MKKFSFSMQKILDLREFEKKQAEGELAKALSEVTKIQSELENIAKRRVAVSKMNDASADFSFRAQSQSYFIMLSQKQEKYLEELAAAQFVAEQKRDAVRQAMQKVKVLEKLRDSKFREWKKELAAEEEKNTDDVVTSRFGQNQ